jgi:hypothetical protein
MLAAVAVCLPKTNFAPCRWRVVFAAARSWLGAGATRMLSRSQRQRLGTSIWLQVGWPFRWFDWEHSWYKFHFVAWLSCYRLLLFIDVDIRYTMVSHFWLLRSTVDIPAVQNASCSWRWLLLSTLLLFNGCKTNQNCSVCRLIIDDQIGFSRYTAWQWLTLTQYWRYYNTTTLNGSMVHGCDS